MKMPYVVLILIFFLLPGGLLASPGMKAPAAPQASGDVITGKVLETMSSGGYTYVLVGKNKEKQWVAVPQMKVSVGSQVTFHSGVLMVDYESKTLKRKFDRIIFSAGPAAPGAAPTPKAAHSGGAKTAMEKVKVERATGPGAYTVSELFKNKNTLQKQTVTVRGKVVKVTPNIMDKNWLHIQDGTGTASKGDYDLVVTTSAMPSEGDVVTVTGTLLKDKDFGMGYKYDLIIEGARIKK